MFTIEVEKKEKDEEFVFTKLNMVHKECRGGKIEVANQLPSGIYQRGEQEEHYLLTCSRCGMSVALEKDSGAVAMICNAAIDARERNIKGKTFEKGIPYVFFTPIDCTAIQKE